MKIIYTSILGCPKNISNKKIKAQAFDNINGFADTLKSKLDKQLIITFITNRWQTKTPKDQPADEVFNDYHYTNKQYVKCLVKCFKLSGFKIKKIIIVDCDYKGTLKEDIESSNLVFIQGGHTPRGLKILKDINFNYATANYNGYVMFTGTSAKLPANKVLSTHHGSMTEFEIEEGLCLKDYSVRPHFSYTQEELKQEKVKNRITLIKNMSKEIKIIAIGANSYMLDDNKEVKIFGEHHIFENGEEIYNLSWRCVRFAP